MIVTTTPSCGLAMQVIRSKNITISQAPIVGIGGMKIYVLPGHRPFLTPNPATQVATWGHVKVKVLAQNIASTTVGYVVEAPPFVPTGTYVEWSPMQGPWHPGVPWRIG